MNSTESIKREMVKPAFIISQRRSGFKNSTYAIAEIIDNSIDAGAKKIRVIFIEKRNELKKPYVDEILICDDGVGMDQNTLWDCLGFGGNNIFDGTLKSRGKNKIGKFGFGLPNASFSQCNEVKVYSWDCLNNRKTFSVEQSIHTMLKTDSTLISQPEEDVFPDFFEKIDAFWEQKTGTIVSWRDLDNLSSFRAETLVKNSESLVGRLFRHKLEGDELEIAFDIFEYHDAEQQYHPSFELIARKNDPLFLMENTIIADTFETALNNKDIDPDGPESYYKQFYRKKKSCLATSQRCPDSSHVFNFEWKGELFVFEITASAVHKDIQKPGLRDGGKQDVGKYYQKMSKEGKISFVRSDREISVGNFGLVQNPNEETFRWWSVEVKFDDKADDLLDVHNNKQGLGFWFVDENHAFEKNTASI